MTLSDIERIFDKLGSVGQIRLMHHLSQRMICSDGIYADTCAWQHVDNTLPHNATDYEREIVFDGIMHPNVTYDGVQPVMNSNEAIAMRLERDIAALGEKVA